MCGIAGVVGDRGPEDVKAVRRMNTALSHRGPDAEGIWQLGRGVLGHRRLSIIDLSADAKQPIVSESGSVGVAVNGEIYNFRELKDDLLRGGHAFRSSSDSEVVVHLYEEMGTRFVEKLSGMFAIAIWDAREGRLVLVRDRAGKKPLYYRFLPWGGFAFASEVHALLVGMPELERRPNPVAIDEFLTLQYVPSPHTAYEGIHKLEAAHMGVLDRGGSFEIRRYWQRSVGPELEDANEVAKELRVRLTRAVQARLASDVPLGAFLSGGIDSSVIVALMAKESGQRVKTFSLGFADATSSELPFARLVAERYGTDHHEEVVEPDIEDIALASVRHHGEPFADSSSIAMFCLARMARRHVTVALSGDGSDEMFGGYARYEAARLAHAYDALPVRLKPVYARALCALARSLSPHLAGYFEHLGDGEATRYPYLMCQFTNEEKEALMEPAMRAATAATRGAIVERFERILGASTRRSAMGRLVDLDASTYLVDDINAKVDTASMAHGLEVRCPFLDVDVMNLAARLPGSMLMHLRGKRILRRAMRDLLPRSVLFRPKRGFALPLLRWMRGPLATLVRDTLLDGRARGRGLFKPREVERLISRIGFDRDAPDRVWTLLMLELWFRQFIDHAPPSGR